MSACRIEETDLPGYYYCTEHRVEMGPDCRDRKHQACAGGPCQCPCHENGEQQ